MKGKSLFFLNIVIKMKNKTGIVKNGSTTEILFQETLSSENGQKSCVP